jgi:hypothetical protein
MLPSQESLSFDGATFDAELDGKRLGSQLRAVFALMRDGRWRTLEEICDETCYHSTAAISARLRDLRKARFGEHMVERRRGAIEGSWQYRLTLNAKTNTPEAAEVLDREVRGDSAERQVGVREAVRDISGIESLGGIAGEKEGRA